MTMKTQRTRDVWLYVSRNPHATQAEIAAACGYRSCCGARYHLDKLAALGYIEWQPYRSRTIRVNIPLLEQLR